MFTLLSTEVEFVHAVSAGGSVKFLPVHNVHFGKYDGPVVKMALYMLQGHIM